MVIKGRARGGPVALAAHLERRDTNERVFVSEFRGVTAKTVRGALREMDAMGMGAASVRTLYHACINTAPGERLTAEQKRHAVDRLEKELGLSGQPRIVVEHLKKNREHMHVVFLRIDTDRMVAIPDNHNYRRHEMVARELEREFGHERVQGAHVERGGKARPARTPSHSEMQQAERTGLPPQQAKARVTQLWKEADSGKAFAAALEADGWVLARGDKRDFVIVDAGGVSHSLARRIEGAKAAEVRARMADIDRERLPDVAAARTRQQERAAVPRLVPMLHVVAPDIVVEAAKPLVPRPRQAPVRTPPAPVLTPVVEQIMPAEAERPRDAAEKRPAPTLFRNLFTAAAGATQKVVGRARELLERKPRPEPTPEAKAVTPQPSHRPNPTPSAETAKSDSRRKRVGAAEIARMLDRQRSRNHDLNGPDR